MRGKNITAALALIAFGLWYAFLASRLPERTLPHTPGPSFLPWVLTVCLLFLSGMLLVQGFRSGAAGAPPSAKSPGGTARAAAGLLLLGAYLGALPYLGFLLATPPLFGGLMRAAGERRPLLLVGFSLAVPLFLYVLFQVVFQMPLPPAWVFG